MLTAAQAQECLEAGWPGTYQNNACKVDKDYIKHASSPKLCSNQKLSCNPSVFSEGICIKKSAINSNLTCLAAAKSVQKAKIAQFTEKNKQQDELFNTTYEALQMMCFEGLGDERNQAYCPQVREWFEAIITEKNKIRGLTEAGDQIEALARSANHIEEHLTGKPLGPTITEKVLEDKPEIFNSERASALPIPAHSRIFTGRPNNENLVIRFPSMAVALHRYETNPTKLIPNAPSKQFYLDFKRVASLPAQQELKLNSYAISQELVDRMRSNFDPDHKKEIITLLNSLDKSRWKKLLIGEQDKQGDIFRFGGLLEVRRKYHDTNEHLSIMTNDKFSGTEFEKEYFIPTGFIEVEENQYLSLQEIANGNIEIDPVTFRVKILKEVAVLAFTEIDQTGGIDEDLKALANTDICLRECIVPDSVLVGDVVQVISKIQAKEKSEANGAAYCLLLNYYKACPTDERLLRLEEIKSRLKLKSDCSELNPKTKPRER